MVPLLAAACASIVGFPDVPDIDGGGESDARGPGIEAAPLLEASSSSGDGTVESSSIDGSTPEEAGSSNDGTSVNMSNDGTLMDTSSDRASTPPKDTGPSCPLFLWANNVDGGTCAAAAGTAGLPLSCTYLASGASGIKGAEGYAYVFTDTGGSTACLNEKAFCASGMTTVLLPNNDAAASTTYGAGLGVNLNQAEATSPTPPPNNPYTFPAGTTGISYTLDSFNFPNTQVRLNVGDNDGTTGTDYCAIITAASGTVPWSDFNSKCYDVPPDGASLTGPPPSTIHLQFTVTSASSATTAQPFNFCITALSFAP
jgi:hypothetical protein